MASSVKGYGRGWEKVPAESFLREFAAKWYAYRIMGMPSLLRKVFLVDLLQGLKVTFRYQDPKEIYTEQ